MDQVAANILSFLLEVKEAIIKEIQQQGHVASGRLINTIETEVRGSLDSYIGYIRMQDYSEPLNTGFKPKYSPGSGAGTSKYIQALIDWVELKQIGEASERKSIAFAIAATAKKTGHPTPGSYAYSQNARRKEFAKYAIEPMLNNFEQRLGLESIFIGIFEDAIKQATA